MCAGNMLYLMVLGFMVCSISGTTYSGYKVFNVIPHNKYQAAQLMRWEGRVGIDFWMEPRVLEEPSVVMVDPKNLINFQKFLRQNQLTWNITIEDVNSIIKEDKRRRSDIPHAPKGKFSFTNFHKYQVINDYLDQLATDYPDFVTVTDEGESYEKRIIKSVLISDKKVPGNKTLIITDGGIHAREWISPAFCVYLIHELVERRVSNKDMLENVDWLIVPLLNPDGYEHTHEKNRFWRKTRKPDESKPDCFGVDGNRNYAHHWGEAGASDEPCSETYKGPKAGSEPETQVMSNLMTKMARKGRTAYLSFHSYGCWILYPWSYTSAPPPRRHLLQRLGEKAADAIHMNTGRIYKVGNTVELLYAAAGGSHDFALGEAGIELAFTFELPPRGTGMEGFAPPPEDILPICKETMYGIREIALYLGQNY